MRYPVNYIAITYGYHFGKSIDFGYCSHKYQDIMSIADGKVLKTEIQKDGCKVIFIKHDSGIVSCYGHLDSFLVKKGQKVILGQKIGTMGQSGNCTGMHLHLGIYSKEKADIGFNKKGLYGNADIDPFSVLYVYKGQDTSEVKDPYKSLLKFYDDKEVWKAGDYKLLYEKAVRKSHNLGNNIQIVGLMKAAKPYLTSQNFFDKAILKSGTDCKIESIYDEDGRIWGAFGKYWIVLCNIDGTPQAKRI